MRRILRTDEARPDQAGIRPVMAFKAMRIDKAIVADSPANSPFLMFDMPDPKLAKQGKPRDRRQPVGVAQP